MAKSYAVQKTACSPHYWRMPTENHRGLKCQICGTFLPFHRITEGMKRNILQRIYQTYGKPSADAFESVWNQAEKRDRIRREKQEHSRGRVASREKRDTE